MTERELKEAIRRKEFELQRLEAQLRETRGYLRSLRTRLYDSAVMEMAETGARIRPQHFKSK